MLAEAASNMWLQYGALGLVAAVLIPFARSAYNDQKNRADRLEEQLREQNKLIQEKLVTELTRATEAIAATLSRRRGQ